MGKSSGFSLITIIGVINGEFLNSKNIINHNQIKNITPCDKGTFIKNIDKGTLIKNIAPYDKGTHCLMETYTGKYIIKESFESMKETLIYYEDDIISGIGIDAETMAGAPDLYYPEETKGTKPEGDQNA